MSRAGLSQAQAEGFARIALGHLRREYPNKPDHVLEGPGDALTPRALHPVFFGSFDWHSCVHGYWMLARLLRLWPEHALAAKTRALFDEQLLPGKVAVECAYFARPSALGFKRPYGWAWLLKLASELAELGEPRWADALAPLADVIAARFVGFLPRATYPVRAGTHFNTAFALRLAADFARVKGDAALLDLLRQTALGWYGGDHDCPAWGEPGGDDFLSPTLIEAECMRSLLPADAFGDWFARFLPDLAQGQPVTLFRPAYVSDRNDGKIAHLDGLNLSRAWCLHALLGSLPIADPRVAIMRAGALEHLAAALPHVTGDYMGEHWLASFAVLALEG